MEIKLPEIVLIGFKQNTLVIGTKTSIWTRNGSNRDRTDYWYGNISQQQQQQQQQQHKNLKSKTSSLYMSLLLISLSFSIISLYNALCKDIVSDENIY